MVVKEIEEIMEEMVVPVAEDGVQAEEQDINLVVADQVLKFLMEIRIMRQYAEMVVHGVEVVELVADMDTGGMVVMVGNMVVAAEVLLCMQALVLADLEHRMVEEEGNMEEVVEEDLYLMTEDMVEGMEEPEVSSEEMDLDQLILELVVEREEQKMALIQ